jgi:hypothetical protein
MSAAAKDHAYIVTVKKDAKPMPAIKKERIAAAKTNVAKYLKKK